VFGRSKNPRDFSLLRGVKGCEMSGCPVVWLGYDSLPTGVLNAPPTIETDPLEESGNMLLD
jgi:hypothetical protein